MPARQPATAECGLAQHSPPHTPPHSLLPSLTASLSNTHSTHTEPGTRTRTRTHTHTDTHPRAAREGRWSPTGAYLGGRRQLPGTAQSEPPRGGSPASSQQLLAQSRPEARHRAAELQAHSHHCRRHLQHPPPSTAGTNRSPPHAPPRGELGKCSLGSGAMGRWALSLRPVLGGEEQRRETFLL